MARQESPREDLLAEATALVERAELLPADAAEPIVMGFRTNGAASVFFDQDTAYHFNSDGELRRAYLAGRLVKADRGRLASLDRHRIAGAVQLVRHDLNAEETDEVLGELHRRLVALRMAISTQRVKLVRQLPEDADVLPRILAWLAMMSEPIRIARNPRVR